MAIKSIGVDKRYESAPQADRESAVELLRKHLERAERGEIVGVAIVGLQADGQAVASMSFPENLVGNLMGGLSDLVFWLDEAYPEDGEDDDLDDEERALLNG